MMNKRGVSLMISYVLLVGMVVTIGLLVASWIYIQARNPPIGEEQECEGVSVSASEISCNGKVEATIKNNGRFTIYKIYTKVDPQSENVLRFDLMPLSLEEGLKPGQEMEFSQNTNNLPSNALPINYVRFMPAIDIICTEQATYEC